jgi:hypothetical protein
VGIVVEIAAADPGGAHGDEHLAGTGSGLGDFFFADVLRTVEDEGFHGVIHGYLRKM